MAYALALILLFAVSVQGEVSDLYKRAREEQNVDKAVELYWQYFGEAKGDSAFPDAASNFARLLAGEDRFADLVRLGDRLLELKPPPASPLNTIAWALAEGDTALDKALSYIEVGVAAQRQNINLPPPSDRSEKAWKERQNYRLGYYLDTKGYVLLKLDRAEEAREAFLQVESLIPEPDYELYLHLAMANRELNEFSDALRCAVKARYYLGDEGNEDLDRVLREAYWGIHGSSDGLEEYLDSNLEEIRRQEYVKLVADKVDQPAPNFELQSLKGNTVRLADYRGKIILLDFWATWCGPCRRELPLLQSAYSEWKKQGIELLAISTDKDTAKVAPFIAENQYTFPVLFNNGTSIDYDVVGIPTLFVIDQNGRIQYRHVGYRPDIIEILDVQIKALRR